MGARRVAVDEASRRQHASRRVGDDERRVGVRLVDDYLEGEAGGDGRRVADRVVAVSPHVGHERARCAVLPHRVAADGRSQRGREAAGGRPAPRDVTRHDVTAVVTSPIACAPNTSDVFDL